MSSRVIKIVNFYKLNRQQLAHRVLNSIKELHKSLSVNNDSPLASSTVADIFSEVLARNNSIGIWDCLPDFLDDCEAIYAELVKTKVLRKIDATTERAEIEYSISKANSRVGLFTLSHFLFRKPDKFEHKELDIDILLDSFGLTWGCITDHWMTNDPKFTAPGELHAANWNLFSHLVCRIITTTGPTTMPGQDLRDAREFLNSLEKFVEYMRLAFEKNCKQPVMSLENFSSIIRHIYRGYSNISD